MNLLEVCKLFWFLFFFFSAKSSEPICLLSCHVHQVFASLILQDERMMRDDSPLRIDSRWQISTCIEEIFHWLLMPSRPLVLQILRRRAELQSTVSTGIKALWTIIFERCDPFFCDATSLVYGTYWSLGSCNTWGIRSCWCMYSFLIDSSYTAVYQREKTAVIGACPAV